MMEHTLPRALENPFLANDLPKYIPTTKVEEWKYTNLLPVKANLAAPEKSGTTEDLEKLLPVLSGPTLVMVNGHKSTELSMLAELPDHIRISTEATPQTARPAYLKGLQLPRQGVLGDVAFAFDNHPVTIQVAASAQESILHLVTVGWGNGGPAGGGLRIYLEPGAKLLLVEHLVGSTPHAQEFLWLNTAREVQVATGAHMRYVTVQNLPKTMVGTETRQVHVATGATYEAFTLQLGGHISRQESDIAMEATANIAQHSLQLIGAGQTHDVTTRMWLKGESPLCNVTQRNLVGGKDNLGGGHAVFQGKFYVAQAAQKTDAYMRCENLLLHDDAHVSQKPELEIYADDVKCSHGASTGSLDAEQLFYLKARGINEANARQLLVAGFVEAQLEKFPDPIQTLVRPLVTKAIAEVVG